jgi:hypothetical protein
MEINSAKYTITVFLTKAGMAGRKRRQGDAITGENTGS